MHDSLPIAPVDDLCALQREINIGNPRRFDVGAMVQVVMLPLLGVGTAGWCRQWCEVSQAGVGRLTGNRTCQAVACPELLDALVAKPLPLGDSA